MVMQAGREMRRVFSLLLASFVAIGMNELDAQEGDAKDRPGTMQQMRVPAELIPDSPVLSPAEALKSFSLVPGFEIQLVAAEPLIQSPVAMEFDHEGQLWVVEMSGYMPNPDGKGEDRKVGSIVTLSDTDGDGTMDSRVVFLGGLQMPRALCLVDDGVLIAEPPNLLFCRDTNGDGVSDTREVVDDNYGSQVNPEHTANGLMKAMDNWIYSANHDIRYRRQNGKWLKEGTISRGQWGMSQDNFGRLYYNSNSDQLRVDLFPSAYLERNPNAGRLSGASYRTTADQTVWPGRVNPGVNRGYQSQTLRDENHTLATYTAASGPVIYRGANFPSGFLNNGFIPEPSANFIRRNILTEIHGTISAENAYFQSEFLTSTDERFRPVNLYNGPEGALYIVDFYRGLIQHRIYLTSYLRKQIEERGLDNPVDCGRIYRVIASGTPLPAFRPLSKNRPAQLVRALGNRNGWVRDAAQRLLVELGERAPLDAIQSAAVNQSSPLGRLHALWTLHGLDALDEAILKQSLMDPDAKVRSVSVRMSETFFRSGGERSSMFPHVMARQSDPAFEPKIQLAFSLGELPAAERVPVLTRMMLFGCDNEWLQNASLSSMNGAEEIFLSAIAQERAWNIPHEKRARFISRVSACLLNSRQSDRFTHVVDMALALPQSSHVVASAILSGLVSPLDRNKNPLIRIQLSTKPDNWLAVAEKNPLLKDVLSSVAWSEKANENNASGANKLELAPGELTPVEQERFDKGKLVYAQLCGACHQPHGRGQEGLAPPLVDSEWVDGSKDRLIRIVLHGLQGPISVNNVEYNMLMPGLAVLDDDQIASALTFVRRSFGHTSTAVSPAEVRTIRDASSDQQDLWTAEQLQKLP